MGGFMEQKGGNIYKPLIFTGIYNYLQLFTAFYMKEKIGGRGAKDKDRKILGSAAAPAAVRRALAPNSRARSAPNGSRVSHARAGREGATRCARGGRAPHFLQHGYGLVARLHFVPASY